MDETICARLAVAVSVTVIVVMVGLWLTGPWHGIANEVVAIAGSHDYLAPPVSVHAAAKFASGPVECLTAGKAQGFKEDYGHGDLVLGRHAPDEVLERVAAFLEGHATPVAG